MTRFESLHRSFYNSPNELQRMLQHGWVFCDSCGKKTNVEDLVEYNCPECAFRFSKKNRIVLHAQQKVLSVSVDKELVTLPSTAGQ